MYGLINASLILFIIFFLYLPTTNFYFLPLVGILLAIIFFGYFCYSSFKQRIRKQVDEQMKISLLAVMMMLFPVILLIAIIGWLMMDADNPKLVLVYGFVVFFGWITAMIMGMTFKTLPFIVWNKVYHLQAGLGKTPNPKDLFSSKIFIVMAVAYLFGFVLFAAGIFAANNFTLQLGAVLLIAAASAYNFNVIKMLLHKSKK